MKGGIYKIIFPGDRTEDGVTVVYVGRSKSVLARWSRHRASFRRGIHENSILAGLYALHGNPQFLLVCRCPPDELNQREAEAISACMADTDVRCANIRMEESSK